MTNKVQLLDSLKESKKASHVLAKDAQPPSPALYIVVFLLWGLCLLNFHGRLANLLDMSYSPLSYASLLFFIGFIEFAWLYGIYNITIVLFSIGYRSFRRSETLLAHAPNLQAPPVAILYTTCNDFVEESALSCVNQDYPDYKVYILDDSSDPLYQARIENFAAVYPHRVEIVRRPDRKAFKAGNMNHGLAHVAIHEPYFAIADADEILPFDFLSRLVPIIDADDTCGFIQANHRANPNASSPLAKALGIGIDIHWKWYQPLRNRFGFVMFLGHGALLRRSCWEQIGGFPEIVSEDLGFAIRIRELGYRGRFVEDVICYEDFPETVRAFRIRHMKWTRGTCEFLAKEAKRLLLAKKITVQEKLDILFPTLNLPLTLLYFLFMLNANLLLPYVLGKKQAITFVAAGDEYVMQIWGLHEGFNTIFTPDFYLITLLTFIAPVLCFILALAHRPLRLFKFLCHSTTLYASLAPLSTIGVLSFILTGKAIFLVTGDKSDDDNKRNQKGSLKVRAKTYVQNLLYRSHPDQKLIQGFELLVGLIFAIICVYLFQISFFGMCLAFILLPVLHHLKWENRWIQWSLYLPFIIIALGLGIGGMSAFGMQTSFFAFGFHF